MSDSDELETLLEKWEFPDMLSVLQENEISIHELKHLTNKDLKEIIPVLGKRIRFREKLFQWKNNNYPQTNEALSETSEEANIFNTPTSYKTLIDVEQVLKSSAEGRSVVHFHMKNSMLLESHRNTIISLLLGEVARNDIKLHLSDFETISQQIVKIFPNENEEFYFLRRGQRKNPGGRFYDKYHNLSSKRRKIQNRCSSQIIQSSEEEEEFDIQLLSQRKELLKTDVSKCLADNCNGLVASETWISTFPIRKRDIRCTENNIELLSHWPGYKQAFGHILIKYDFVRFLKVFFFLSRVSSMTQHKTFRLPDFIKTKEKQQEITVVAVSSGRSSTNH